MIETKNWTERIKQAIALSIGYVIGALVVINLIK
jgi:hypothetical protein